MLLSLQWVLRQGDLGVKVSLLLSETSAIDGGEKGRKGLGYFSSSFWTLS